MVTAVVVLFLIAHGLVHLAVYLPNAANDAKAPFDPGHSWLLADVGVAAAPQRQVGTSLAWASALLYVVAGIAMAVTGAWAVGLTVLAAGTAVVLKLGWFSRWLLLGIALDVAVAAAAIAGWPTALAG